MSYLHVLSTALRFANTLRHESYHLVIKDSACSNHIESVTQQWRKLVPPILSISHYEFNGARLCTQAQKPSFWHQFYYLFTKHTLPPLYPYSLINAKFVEIVFTGFSYAPYKMPPSINNIFTNVSFFSLFYFHHTLFHGLAGVCMDPRTFAFLCIQLYVK